MKQSYYRVAEVERWVALLLAVLALVVLAGCAAVQPAAAPTATSVPPTPTAEPQAAIPQINVEVSENGITVPEEVPGGIVELVVANTGTQPHVPNLIRIREGHNREEALATIAQVAENPESLFSAFEVLSIIHVVDGLEPGATYSFYAALGTGDFFLADDANPDAAPTFFHAAENAGTVAPDADLAVDMVDFAYALPASVPAGQQLWEITNSGEQWHLLAIMKANPELATEVLLAALEGPPAEDSPVQFVGGVAPMGAGERIWVTIDLEAGDYEVVCPLPDVAAAASGAPPLPHLLHGMRAPFSVGS
jgi:hypothetical protein